MSESDIYFDTPLVRVVMLWLFVRAVSYVWLVDARSFVSQSAVQFSSVQRAAVCSLSPQQHRSLQLEEQRYVEDSRRRSA